MNHTVECVRCLGCYIQNSLRPVFFYFFVVVVGVWNNFGFKSTIESFNDVVSSYKEIFDVIDHFGCERKLLSDSKNLFEWVITLSHSASFGLFIWQSQNQCQNLKKKKKQNKTIFVNFNLMCKITRATITIEADDQAQSCVISFILSISRYLFALSRYIYPSHRYWLVGWLVYFLEFLLPNIKLGTSF